MGSNYDLGKLDYSSNNNLKKSILECKDKSGFGIASDVVISNLPGFIVNKVLNPKEDMVPFLDDLYSESTFTSIIDALAEDVFKDFKLIGKKSLIKKAEKFLNDSLLIEELKTTFINEVDSGYGFLEVIRDVDGKIARFNNVDNANVRKCSIMYGNSYFPKYLRKYYDKYIAYNDYKNKDDLSDLIQNDILICKKDSSLDRHYGRGISHGVFIYVMLINYIDCFIMPKLLKNEAMPKVYVTTNLVDDSDVNFDDSEKMKKKLKLFDEEYTKFMNDGYNPQNFVALTNLNPKLKREMNVVQSSSDFEKIMAVRDNYVLQILQAYKMSPYRIGLVLLGGLGGSTSEESNKVYGLNTVLNYQRKYERIVNSFLQEYFDSPDIEIEFERFTLETEEVKAVDVKNESSLEGGETSE